jgi:hypothetical protein
MLLKTKFAHSDASPRRRDAGVQAYVHHLKQLRTAFKSRR